MGSVNSKGSSNTPGIWLATPAHDSAVISECRLVAMAGRLHSSRYQREISSLVITLIKHNKSQGNNNNKGYNFNCSFRAPEKRNYLAGKKFNSQLQVE